MPRVELAKLFSLPQANRPAFLLLLKLKPCRSHPQFSPLPRSRAHSQWSALMRWSRLGDLHVTTPCTRSWLFLTPEPMFLEENSPSKGVRLVTLGPAGPNGLAVPRQRNQSPTTQEIGFKKPWGQLDGRDPWRRG